DYKRNRQHLTASQITGKPKSEIFKFWLNEQVDFQKGMLPSDFKSFDSMQDLLRRYQDICKDIPPEALDGFNRMSSMQKHIIFKTPCRDPKFLANLGVPLEAYRD
ncbi:unnamed protein product, partial [Alternaria alternata]